MLKSSKYYNMYNNSRKSYLFECVFSIDKFKSLRNSVLFAERNYLYELKNIECEYDDKINDENYNSNYVNHIDNYYIDLSLEHVEIQSILIESFFVKYIFLFERLIKNILIKLEKKKEIKYHDCINKLKDGKFKCDLQNLNENFIIDIFRVIRNSIAHGDSTFILTIKEIKKVKDIIDFDFQSEIVKNEEVKRNKKSLIEDVKYCKLANNFDYFQVLHNFYIMYIDKIKKKIESSKKNIML